MSLPGNCNKPALQRRRFDPFSSRLGRSRCCDAAHPLSRITKAHTRVAFSMHLAGSSRTRRRRLRVRISRNVGSAPSKPARPHCMLISHALAPPGLGTCHRAPRTCNTRPFPTLRHPGCQHPRMPGRRGAPHTAAPPNERIRLAHGCRMRGPCSCCHPLSHAQHPLRTSRAQHAHTQETHGRCDVDCNTVTVSRHYSRRARLPLMKQLGL